MFVDVGYYELWGFITNFCGSLWQFVINFVANFVRIL